MLHQAEMLSQVLKLAQAKAQALVQAVPQAQIQQEAKALLLLREVEKVLRQAVALQQLVLLQGVPLQEREALQLVQEPLELAQVEPQVEVEVLAQGSVVEWAVNQGLEKAQAVPQEA